MTCLTTLLTWKWPGCLDVLAPLLLCKEKFSFNVFLLWCHSCVQSFILCIFFSVSVVNIFSWVKQMKITWFSDSEQFWASESCVTDCFCQIFNMRLFKHLKPRSREEMIRRTNRLCYLASFRLVFLAQYQLIYHGHFLFNVCALYLPLPSLTWTLIFHKVV